MSEFDDGLLVKVQATVPGIPVCGTATYFWDKREPMAVQMTVELPAQTPITWHFTRDMLDSAFNDFDRFIGEGDVMVKAETGRLHYWLAADGGQRHSIYTSLDPVMSWVLETFKVVRPENEAANVDLALAELLGGAA